MAVAKLFVLLLAAGAVACVLTGCQSSKDGSPSAGYFTPSATDPIQSLAMRVSTNVVSTNRILIIDPSFMPIAAGKATLTIGVLQRVNGIYTGDYKVRVTPFFLKNEHGRLAIVVSDESLARVNRGEVATIVGTSTTSGKDRISRHIDAIATPTDIDHGKLKLWFMAGDRKMTFEPAYHFADKRMAGGPAPVPPT